MVFFSLFPYNISLNNISVPFIAFSVKHTSNPESDHVSTSLFLVSAFLKVTSAFYSSSFYFIVYSLSCSFIIKFRISLIYYNPIPTNIFYLFFKLLSHWIYVLLYSKAFVGKSSLSFSSFFCMFVRPPLISSLVFLRSFPGCFFPTYSLWLRAHISTECIFILRPT